MALPEIPQRRPRAGLTHHRHSFPVLIEPENLARETGGEIELSIGSDQQPARQPVELPGLDELSVEIEHLDAPVLAVGNQHLVVGRDEDRVRLIELSRLRALATPALDE